MLRNLHIQNYALIDQLDIEFHPGLNIVTGETGAGKSILLGALALILGQRADVSVLKDKSRSCIVEGLFDISGYNLHEFFKANDIDYFDSTIIRRQINETGKSRAFVNEVPVTLNLLRDIGALLIDIHSQHENLLLGNSQFQLNVIDSFAMLQDDLTRYREQYGHYKELKRELEALEGEAERSRKDFDYLSFQLKELDDAKLKTGELSELESVQNQQTHAHEIKNALQGAYEALDSEGSALALLKESEALLKRVQAVFPVAAELEKRIGSCRIELRDIAGEIERHNATIEVDPSLLEQVSARLDLLYSLLQKHRVKTIDELITIRDDLQRRVNFISNLDFNLDSKRKQLNELEGRLKHLARGLTEKRRSTIPRIESSIIGLLVQLGIKHADFKVDLQPIPEFQPWGLDRVIFFFTANKQMPVQELSRVASGGELSRLMLSLKSLMVKSTDLPTIIFDEIDTGVSGEIADKMGNIINDMARGMQVINITHLPQIASKGRHHFLVYKDNMSSHSSTRIKLLFNEERIIEVAKMLSGERLTDAALSNARELLASNGN
jgi:DNA repair protein RecN (Recombination protein N)